MSRKSTRNRGEEFDGIRAMVWRELPEGVAVRVKYRSCASVAKEPVSLLSKSVLGQQMKCEQSQGKEDKVVVVIIFSSASRL